MAVLPADAGGCIYLGALIVKTGRLRESEAIHRRATRCKTGPIDEAYLNLGYVLRAQERFEEALHCFKKALEISPRYPEAERGLRDISELQRICRGKRLGHQHDIGQF